MTTYGYSNLEAKTPVTADSLFEIGSISKSFTAISLLQLSEQGNDKHQDRRAGAIDLQEG